MIHSKPSLLAGVSDIKEKRIIGTTCPVRVPTQRNHDIDKVVVTVNFSGSGIIH